MPKISIITTTYKHADFIAHTIESVLSQTYTDRELLIGDDSPDDATRDIISSYTSRYPNKIKARHHIANKGIVDNMNFLISQSSQESEYLSFLEGDDMYTPDNLQQKIHIFEHYPEVMLVHSDISIVDKNGNVTIDSLYQNNKDGIHNALFSGNNIMYNKNTFLLDPTSIISYSIGMIRRESTYAIRSLRDSKNYSVSDREMYLKLLTMYHSYFISSQLVKYRIYNTSISKTKGILGYDMSILLGTLFNEKFWDKKVALGYIAKNFFTNIDIRTLIRRIKIIIYIFFPAKINNLIFKILYGYKE